MMPRPFLGKLPHPRDLTPLSQLLLVVVVVVGVVVVVVLLLLLLLLLPPLWQEVFLSLFRSLLRCVRVLQFFYFLSTCGCATPSCHRNAVAAFCANRVAVLYIPSTTCPHLMSCHQVAIVQSSSSIAITAH
jgi:hypothetical protein